MKNNNTTLGDFRLNNPDIVAYRSDRVALGVNCGKVALGFIDGKVVCSVVFIDHLYEGGRVIYVPHFDKKFVSEDGITARLDCHRFIESQMHQALAECKFSESSWRFG